MSKQEGLSGQGQRETVRMRSGSLLQLARGLPGFAALVVERELSRLELAHAAACAFMQDWSD